MNTKQYQAADFSCEEVSQRDGGFMAHAVAFLLSSQQDAVATSRFAIRLPQLPSIRNGLGQGIQSLMSLAISGFGKPDAAVEKTKAACGKHPESLLPLAAATFLEPHRPTDPRKLRDFLTTQTELLQLTAAPPSVVPNAHRLARLMAALNQVELCARLSPPIPEACPACLTNLKWFLEAEGTSADEYKACFHIAFELKEFNLARDLLVRWESSDSDDASAKRSRIQLELAAGAYDKALQAIDALLAKDPANAWALDRRKDVLRGIKHLAESSGLTLQPER